MKSNLDARSLEGAGREVVTADAVFISAVRLCNGTELEYSRAHPMNAADPYTCVLPPARRRALARAPLSPPLRRLAAASNAPLIGFNVRPDRKARDLADAEGVEIRTYEIIYKLLEDIERAMLGMLAPEFEEVVTGEAEVREIFLVPRIGAIAGCLVRSGVITRGSKVRFLRDGSIIWKGSIQSLKRFKEDAREVREGFECGVGLSDFQDLKPGDLIETYEEREIARV